MEPDRTTEQPSLLELRYLFSWETHVQVLALAALYVCSYHPGRSCVPDPALTAAIARLARIRRKPISPLGVCVHSLRENRHRTAERTRHSPALDSHPQSSALISPVPSRPRAGQPGNAIPPTSRALVTSHLQRDHTPSADLAGATASTALLDPTISLP